MSAKIQVYRKSDTQIIYIEIFIVMCVVAAALIGGADFHPALGIVLAFFAGGALFYFFGTDIGFFVVTGVFSFIWGSLSGYFIYSLTEDWTWSIFSGFVVLLISFSFHSLAKRYHDNVEDY